MENKYRLNIPRLNLLSEQKCEKIHCATLEVLRRTGVSVKDPEAVGILKDGGCITDGDRVRIPDQLVEQALENTPSSVVVSDRNGNPAMYLEENNTYFGTGSDTPFVLDTETGERRHAVLKDIEKVSRLVDFCEELNFLMCSGIANDVNSRISDLYHFQEMVNNTEKPIVYTAWSLENLQTIVKMAEAVAGSAERFRNHPFAVLYTEPISPLQLAKESAQKLMYMAKKSLPVVFTPCLIAGGAGPVTPAGALVQGNAEILAGYVLSNLIREGAPFIYGGGIGPMDMASGIWSYASPEFMLMEAALVSMARYYDLPLYCFAGCSDSLLYDQQASLEASMRLLMSALTGGNLVHDVGYLESGLTTSFEQVIVSNEVIGMVRRITQGFEINEEELALDLIDATGPGGDFLSSEHTLKHFKKNWNPDLILRVPYEKWQASGGKDLGSRARERVQTILNSHVPRQLEDNLKIELKQMVQAMER